MLGGLDAVCLRMQASGAISETSGQSESSPWRSAAACTITNYIIKQPANVQLEQERQGLAERLSANFYHKSIGTTDSPVVAA